MVVLKNNSEYRNNYVSGLLTGSGWEAYSDSVAFRTQRKSADYSHNKDAFTWEPNGWEKDSCTNVLSEEQHPGKNPSTKYKHALYTKAYRERMKILHAQGECKAVSPRREENNNQKSSSPKTPPPSVTTESPPTSKQSPKQPTTSQCCKAKTRPKKPMHTDCKAMPPRPKSAGSSPSTAVAVDLTPRSKSPFLAYGAKNREPVNDAKMTHNIRAQADVYPAALKVHKWREEQKQKKRKTAEVKKRQLITFDEIMDRETERWRSEYDDHYVAYRPADYLRNAMSRASLRRSRDGVEEALTHKLKAFWCQHSPQIRVEAILARDGANRFLKYLTKAHIYELRSMHRPPFAILFTLEAVCILLDVEPYHLTDTKLADGVIDYWGPAKGMMKDPQYFLDKIRYFDWDEVYQDKVTELQPYIDNEVFYPEVLKKISVPCMYLCMWVRAVYNFARNRTNLDELQRVRRSGNSWAAYRAAQNDFKKIRYEDERTDIPPSRWIFDEEEPPILRREPYRARPASARERYMSENRNEWYDVENQVREARDRAREREREKPKEKEKRVTIRSNSEERRGWSTCEPSKKCFQKPCKTAVDDSSDENVDNETEFSQLRLQEAMSAQQACKQILKNVSKGDITELKSLAKPPELVKMTLEALCVMLGEKPTKISGKFDAPKYDYWLTSKKMLADAGFLARLLSFDVDSVSNDVIAKLEPYIKHEDFKPEAVKKVSAACTSLCQLIRAVYSYAKMKPIIDKLRAINGQRQDNEPVASSRNAQRLAEAVWAERHQDVSVVSPQAHLERPPQRHSKMAWAEGQGDSEAMSNNRPERFTQRRIETDWAGRQEDESRNRPERSPQRHTELAWVDTPKQHRQESPHSREKPEKTGKAVMDDHGKGFSQERLQELMAAQQPAMDSLSKGDFQELKSLANPPELVKMTLAAMCITLGEKPVRIGDSKETKFDYWPTAKKLLSNPKQFLDRLRSFDVDNVPREVVAKLERYIKHRDFNPEAVSKVSKACTAICEWVRAVYSCGKMGSPRSSPSYTIKRDGQRIYDDEKVSSSKKRQERSPPLRVTAGAYLVEQKRQESPERREKSQRPGKDVDAQFQRSLEIQNITPERRNEAIVARDACFHAIRNLKRNEIIILASLQKPPQAIKLLLEAVCTLLGVKPLRKYNSQLDETQYDYWAVAGRMMSDANAFLKTLLTFDVDNVSSDVILKLEPYIRNPEFTREEMMKKSAACGSLCDWIRAVYSYARLKPILKYDPPLFPPPAVRMYGGLGVRESMNYDLFARPNSSRGQLRNVEESTVPPRGDRRDVAQLPVPNRIERHSGRKSPVPTHSERLNSAKSPSPTLKGTRGLSQSSPTLHEKRAPRSFSATLDEMPGNSAVARHRANELRAENYVLGSGSKQRLMEALAAKEEARKSLSCIGLADISELKSLKAPPVQVKLACEAACVLLGLKPEKIHGPSGESRYDMWGPSKAMLGEPNFVKRLQALDLDNIPEKYIKRIERYLKFEEFKPENMVKACRAALGLCKWVRAVHKYHFMVAPHRHALQIVEDDLKKTKHIWQESQLELSSVQSEIEALRNAYNEHLRRKEELKAKCAVYRTRTEQLLNFEHTH